MNGVGGESDEAFAKRMDDHAGLWYRWWMPNSVIIGRAELRRLAYLAFIAARNESTNSGPTMGINK